MATGPRELRRHIEASNRTEEQYHLGHQIFISSSIRPLVIHSEPCGDGAPGCRNYHAVYGDCSPYGAIGREREKRMAERATRTVEKMDEPIFAPSYSTITPVVPVSEVVRSAPTTVIPALPLAPRSKQSNFRLPVEMSPHLSVQTALPVPDRLEKQAQPSADPRAPRTRAEAERRYEATARSSWLFSEQARMINVNHDALRQYGQELYWSGVPGAFAMCERINDILTDHSRVMTTDRRQFLDRLARKLEHDEKNLMWWRGTENPTNAERCVLQQQALGRFYM